MPNQRQSRCDGGGGAARKLGSDEAAAARPQAAAAARLAGVARSTRRDREEDSTTLGVGGELSRRRRRRRSSAQARQRRGRSGATSVRLSARVPLALFALLLVLLVRPGGRPRPGPLQLRAVDAAAATAIAARPWASRRHSAQPAGLDWASGRQTGLCCLCARAYLAVLRCCCCRGRSAGGVSCGALAFSLSLVLSRSLCFFSGRTRLPRKRSGDFARLTGTRLSSCLMLQSRS
jgi:hypothetical protein